MWMSKYNISKIAGSNKGYIHTKKALKIISSTASIPIIQCNKNGEVIKEWKSATMASKKLKINICSIRKCCRNEHKIAGGYIWKNK